MIGMRCGLRAPLAVLWIVAGAMISAGCDFGSTVPPTPVEPADLEAFAEELGTEPIVIESGADSVDSGASNQGGSSAETSSEAGATEEPSAEAAAEDDLAP
ncbi:MAG TPA: hypothetical protein PLI18_04150 [Pirellulaceae bacterium]|nr:hypothetical protein [Pirellulaceae bacterium]